MRLSPVAAFAATTTAGYGVLFYAYGVLLKPMEDDLGWSRPFLTGVLSLALLISAVLTIVVGRWLDRHEPRPLLLAGGLAATALVACWGLVHGKVAFVAVWVLIGGCQALLFYEPAFTVLTKWYDGAARHRAVTAVTLLAGLASTIFGPLTAALEGALGWRGAVVVLALVIGAITIPCFAFGLHPPAGAHDDDRPTAGPSMLPRDAFREVRFWLVTTAYLLAAITTFAVAVLLVAFLREERGLDSGTAAAALGGVGLIQVLGRSTYTRLSVRWSPIQVGTGVMVAKAVGLVALLAVPGAAGVLAFLVVYGAANGIMTLTRATTIAELYGPRHYGAISAVVSSVGAVAGAAAPFVAAAAIDLAGGQGPVWVGFVVLSLLAAVTNAAAGLPRHSAS